MSENVDRIDLLSLTTDIVSSYVSNHNVEAQDLPSVIEQVFTTLSNVQGQPGGSVSRAADRPPPAVPINRSITDEYLVCLEDGKKLKMLKRHLKTAYDMTPEQYRERWGLPADYPMVAPGYAKLRSKLAKNIGLGTHKKG